MAFPNDLSNVAAFKIHPAIGVARLSNSDKVYEFFDYEAKREAGEAQDLRYMTEQDGHHIIMRQAVQFKLFAYGDDGVELGELNEEVMDALNIKAQWTASIANRKLNHFSDGSTPIINAQASAVSGETKRLEGKNPWRDTPIWLGDITGSGLFVPPKGGVYRETEDKVIPPYGAHTSDNGVQDTTSDGAISVVLEGADGQPVIPACVIVAPQQHSPDVNPGTINNGRNKDFVKETRQLLNIPADGQLSGLGYRMDAAMMATINAEYSPGMEICLNATAVLPDPESAFFPRGTDYINENEIRPSYDNGRADHGALTAGLCSAWQTDLNACLNYWTAEFPNTLVYGEDPEERSLARKEYAAEGPQMSNAEDLNAYIDRMGIGRDLEDDPFYLYGTERDSSDDVGARPVAPFPLDPPH